MNDSETSTSPLQPDSWVSTCWSWLRTRTMHISWFLIFFHCCWMIGGHTTDGNEWMKSENIPPWERGRRGVREVLKIKVSDGGSKSCSFFYLFSVTQKKCWWLSSVCCWIDSFSSSCCSSSSYLGLNLKLYQHDILITISLVVVVAVFVVVVALMEVMVMVMVIGHIIGGEIILARCVQ